jgi:hypothetical protein
MLYLLILDVVIIEYYDIPGDSLQEKSWLDPEQTIVVNEMSVWMWTVQMMGNEKELFHREKSNSVMQPGTKYQLVTYGLSRIVLH